VTGTSAVAFVWDVIAGRSAPSLPADPALRKEVVDLLRLHRLLGLWYVESGQSRSNEGGLPHELSRALRGLHVQRALHTDLTMEAADRARETLAAVGCPSLLFKGAALLRGGVYTDSGARMLGDADILIPEQDVGGAVRALESAGFRSWVPWEDGRKEWLPACTFYDGAAPAGLEITVDLHWRIPYASYRSASREGSGEESRRNASGSQSGLWAGADQQSGLPAPEPHFLLICEHFVRHLRVTPHLVGVADLVRLSADSLDPERLVEEARARRGLRTVRALLAFLRSELALPLESELVEAVGVPRANTGLRARALHPARLLGPPGSRKEGRVSGLLTQSLAFGGGTMLLREIADVLHPPGDWLGDRYATTPGGPLRRRVTHWGAVGLWLLGRGVSPLSPNQEFEDPRR
jgi:putative nucleotidyltransferase-like protein